MKKLMFLLFIIFTVNLNAEEFGIIKGKVTDADTGDPIYGANIAVLNTTLGTYTDTNGKFKLEKVPPGTYSVRASYIGFQSIIINQVIVKPNSSAEIDIKISAQSIENDEISPATYKANLKTVGISAKRLAGGITETFDYYNTEEYTKIDESGFFTVIDKPLSTFAADVDGASYSNARRFLMQDKMPLKDAVRTEEFINYFSYDYPQPAGKDPLTVTMEYSDCPWNNNNKLIHIGLQGKSLSKEEQKPSNLVFLLDVSGSMYSPKKLPLLKRSFKLLVNQLDKKDRVAIVVYAGSAGLILPSTSADEKSTIINSLDELRAGGSTAGGQGIKLAYKVAKENFIKDGNNRVILATDGDFNVGISSTSELVRFIEEKRDDGIFLTVLGFGMGNYKDNRLQELADRGNGNHAYIDNILEAKKVLVNEITSTLFTIAKDVKIQVEFNPANIESYRLIGYENRKLENKDFTDDKKDAGEIGAGHSVTALYEVTLTKDDGGITSQNLKYQDVNISDDAYDTDELLTVKIRYKDPDGSKSKEIVRTLADDRSDFWESSNNFRFSAAVAEFAMLLRNSEFKGSSDYDSVFKIAQSSVGKDKFGYRNEFLNLIERASMLSLGEKEAVLINQK
jgi:Ca-activated chloride channel family protein